MVRKWRKKRRLGGNLRKVCCLFTFNVIQCMLKHIVGNLPHDLVGKVQSVGN